VTGIHHDHTLDPDEPRRLGALAGRLAGAGARLAVVGFAAMLLLAWLGGEHAGRRVLFAYLANFAFFLSLGLGGLVFVLIHSLCRTGTVATYRRLAEIITGTLPYVAVLVLPILIGVGSIYHWPHPQGDAILEAKAPWLNVPFWRIRIAVYLAVFCAIAMHFVRRSFRQDQTGDAKLTLANQAAAGPALIVCAFGITFLAFDLLLSLDGHWFSTIYGIYYFAGAFMAFHALLALAAVRLQEQGFVRSAISTEHYHDIGKMLFAFVVFWAYIAFSQFMLIRYAGIPEETVWFVRHGGGLVEGQPNTFSVLLLLLLFGHFVLPFAGLI
jgi:hypothetical protein